MRAVALKSTWKMVGMLWMVWEKGVREGEKAGVIGGGWTERKERVWEMRIILKLMNKQDKLVEEAEGQRVTVGYIEEAAAKSNLMMGQKRGGVHLPGPVCVCGCQWGSMQAVPQLKAEQGLSDTATRSDMQLLHGNVLLEFHCV